MKIHFTAGHSSAAQKTFEDLTRRYGQADAAKADICVALGGDGHVLRTLYESLETGIPVFAIRRTASVGFLCNDFTEGDLPVRLAQAQKVTLHPLRLDAVTCNGDAQTAWAINEVSVLRETPQAARLRISIDGVERIAQYSGDGILVATPAGSTAYNHSCGGPIMPLDANTLVMTAISGFRPRGWSHAVLPQNAVVEIEALETAKRPVKIEAALGVIHNAARATIKLDRSKEIHLLFDPDQHLGERIIREQFMLDEKN
ncbi:MAG: NAD kinase [Alphaproteobacteria bacterium]|nr:NAD kinase [Alphaproteobacteria bacterium]